MLIGCFWGGSAQAVCYPDVDGDGHGDAQATAIPDEDCAVPGVALSNDDCNDNDLEIHPDAEEICDEVDNDCDGQIDESFPQEGESCTTPCGSGVLVCNIGSVTCNLSQVNAEVCDGFDNDCDGEIDEGYPRQLYYGDCDQDGVGTGVGVLACGAPQSRPLCAVPLQPEDTPWTTASGDCNDNDPVNFPGNPEVCDGLDNNCNNQVDDNPEDANQPCQIDGQLGACQWGHTVCQSGSLSCQQDQAAMDEVCGDGVDNDCDGQTDENRLYFCRDFDSDGYGNSSFCLLACSQPAGYVELRGDCDDSKAAINPGAAEVCDFVDNNCDGRVDEDLPKQYYYEDPDGDTYGTGDPVGPACMPYFQFSASRGGDCDELDTAINPGSMEICDGVDNDCDGSIDETDGALPQQCSSGLPGVCAQGLTGCQSGSEVCIHTQPGDLEEVCGDGLDNDCDGDIDEDPPVWCRDGDGDGHGTSADTVAACSPPSGYVARCGDCDDTRGDVYPGADEVCNGIDNNCVDGVEDEILRTWCPDDDLDGFGDSDRAVQSCGPPPGHVGTCGDCNDNRDDIHPGAEEICNGIDNNCVDGTLDEDRRSFHRDSDGDGYGSAFSTVTACAAPSGYVDNNLDCNDARDDIYPGAPEPCDNVDNNCFNGTADEATVGWCRDADGDGFGDPNVSAQACSPPLGYIADCNDCDDTRSDVYPGAFEVCDGVDNNCQAGTDDEIHLTVYLDLDQDGFGESDQTMQVCARPVGYALAGGDCEPNDDTAYPGALELCDTVDNNCDGRLNEGCGCVPGAPEYCDGEDNDCDGEIDEGNPQGGGSCSTGQPGICAVGQWLCDAGALRCDAPPAEAEVCDGLDNDCDGLVDESFPSQNAPCAVGGAQGPCAQGVTVCSYGAEACVGPSPQTETCDNIDNDCDGEIDEEIGRSCSSVCGTGTESCEAGVWGSCTARQPSLEICDNVDNDCDGSVDESLVRSCRTDCGAGTRVCHQGAFSSCTAPQPTREVCDGVDNDCNGLTDDSEACGCTLVTEVGPPSIQAEWTWSGSATAPTFNEVISTPIVAQMNDDNGDGRIDGDDVPDVIFVSASDNFAAGALLRVLNGADGSERWSWGSRPLRVQSSPAVADIDLDGFPEVVAYVLGGGLVAISHTGAEEWFLPDVNSANEVERGSPAIANVDRFSPGAEIVSCFWLASAQGELIWETRSTMPTGYTPRGFCAPVVADVDNDGEVEILIGARAFNHDGTILWSNNTLAAQWSGDYDIAPALADLDGDGEPELVVVRGEVFVLRARDGALLAHSTIPSGGQGGAPVLADLDGDGLPEIGVAGAREFVAMKLVDGPLRLEDLWTVEIRDFSSSTTGASAFDFNGDGRQDIVYNDELYLRILEGHTGAILLEERNWSGTAVEYPVVADVDGDGEAEILVARNNIDDHFDDYGDWDNTPQSGLRVYGETTGAWVSARGAWNQYAWSGAQFEDDNTVPGGIQRYWESPNTNRFRTSQSLSQSVELAPDVTVENFAYRQGASAGNQPNSMVPWCPAYVEVDLEICNRGDVPVMEDLQITITLDDPEGPRVVDQLETVSLEVADPNRCTTLTLSWMSSTTGTRRLYATVDAANVLAECDEDNNVRSLGPRALKAPSQEVCDGLDNDCNAQVDEDEDGNDLERACDVVCGAGTQVCSGGSWTACSEQVVAEICDGVDNDCDGDTDEDTCPEGFSCVDGGSSYVCIAVQTVRTPCELGCPLGTVCAEDGSCVAMEQPSAASPSSFSPGSPEPAAGCAVQPGAPAKRGLPWGLWALGALGLWRLRR